MADTRSTPAVRGRVRVVVARTRYARIMAILSDIDDVREVLAHRRRIAVLGASIHEHRPGHYVPRYLAGEDYQIYPVNPTHLGKRLFGREVVATLSDVGDEIEIVEVFRRSDHLPDHVDDILALDPLPKVVWFQLGVRNDKVAERLSEAGIDVIQDRCMLADHQALF